MVEQLQAPDELQTECEIKTGYTLLTTDLASNQKVIIAESKTGIYRDTHMCPLSHFSG